MSTTTTNLGLVKPEYADTADVQVINQNMDKIDDAIGGVMGSIAIVANGNTHAAIASGQYVYVLNHSTLAEGLYRATAAIAANATLSTSNLTAVSGGGLNAVTQNIISMIARGQMCERFEITVDNTVVPDASLQTDCFYSPASNVVHLHIRIFSDSGAIPPAGGIVATVPEKYRPADQRVLGFCMVSDGTLIQPPSIEGCYIDRAGRIRMNNFVYGEHPVRLFYLNASYSIT